MKQLRDLLATLDEDALATLASRGLVRRARKDLAAGRAPTLKEISDDAAIFMMEEFVVTLPFTGPANAQCTCPSPGVCRHILAVVLHVQASSPQQEPSATEQDRSLSGVDAASELLGIDTQQLGKWAGRKNLRQANDLLSKRPKVQIEQRAAVLVRFPELGFECRYVAGAGLDGVITNARSRDRKKMVAAAVLAFRRSQGLDEPEAAATAAGALDEATGAPRSREQVLQSARMLLCELVKVGLSHVSTAARDRLITLSVSAIGAQLPRLARGLRRVAHEADLIVQRHAQADERNLLGRIADAVALCQALQATRSSPRPDLIGRHRSRYEPVAELELCGLGAYVWRTQSGYEGITVLFWSPQHKAFYSWSDSRPIGDDPAFQPALRYEQLGPWAGSPHIRELAPARLRLHNAKVNDQNRLSSSEQTRVQCVGPTEPGEIDFGNRAFASWAALRRYAADVYPIGLAEPAELDPLVIVAARSLANRRFDEIDQTVLIDLIDNHGDVLSIAIPYTDQAERMVSFFDSIAFSTEAPMICGRIVYRSATVVLYPLTALAPKPTRKMSPTTSFMLERVGTKPRATNWLARLRKMVTKPRELAGSFDSLDEQGPVWSPRTEVMITACEDRLIAAAEAGRPADALAARQAGDQARTPADLGFTYLAPIGNVPASPPDAAAERLIRQHYLYRLHRQAAVVAALSPAS